MDMFLKIDHVSGESKDNSHAGEIDVLAWSFGESTAAPRSLGRRWRRQGERAGPEHHQVHRQELACAAARLLPTESTTGPRGSRSARPVNCRSNSSSWR